MLRSLLLAGVLALGAAACTDGSQNDRPAPTVMGDEQGPSEPGATLKPQPPDNYP